MKQISWSPLFGQIFDVVWLGFMTLWTAMAVVASVTQRSMLAVIFVGAGALFWAFGFFTLKRDWKLVDEVFDAGDALVVRKGSVEARIAFQEIRSIDELNVIRPQRVLLDLIQPNKLGSQISFIPRTTFGSVFGAGQSVADSLRVRISRRT